MIATPAHKQLARRARQLNLEFGCGIFGVAAKSRRLRVACRGRGRHHRDRVSSATMLHRSQRICERASGRSEQSGESETKTLGLFEFASWRRWVVQNGEDVSLVWISPTNGDSVKVNVTRATLVRETYQVRASSRVA